MNSTIGIRQEGSVEQADEQGDKQAAAEQAELRPTVDLEIQGKVDTNHPDARPEGMTLEGQERFEAREAEIKATRQRADDRQQSDREARSRSVASQGSRDRRRAFQQRAASVRPSRGPDDARERCSQVELAAINQKAARVSEELDRWPRAVIARQLARHVVDGADVQSAALSVIEAYQREAGTLVPIAAVPKVDRAEVSIEGTVVTLWESDHPSISQVGLIEDDTDRIKFTSWAASRQAVVSEGQQVALRQVQKNWYNGRCSVALTGQSEVLSPERAEWLR